MKRPTLLVLVEIQFRVQLTQPRGCIARAGAVIIIQGGEGLDVTLDKEIVRVMVNKEPIIIIIMTTMIHPQMMLIMEIISMMEMLIIISSTRMATMPAIIKLTNLEIANLVPEVEDPLVIPRMPTMASSVGDLLGAHINAATIIEDAART